MQIAYLVCRCVGWTRRNGADNTQSSVDCENLSKVDLERSLERNSVRSEDWTDEQMKR